ncbi:MAG TPA: hypothetical protein VEY09_13325 [Pyrinomonadaceae bacterium]|nr:hypothetical protein [Pyrinomonadaceae bacterium]
MKRPTFHPHFRRKLAGILVGLALGCLGHAPAHAQTAGGTVIENQASASYGDGGGNTYETISNKVTVTVANVAGLTITPDDTAGSGASGNVVAGNPTASVTLAVSNSGNFANTVTFKAGGASLIVSGAITSANLTAAFFDANSNGVFDAGDTDILSNGSDVASASIPAGQSRNVVVRFSVPAAASGQINIQLGDAATGGPTFDSQPVAASAADVVATTAGVNGQVEARGLASLSVLTDVAIQTTLSGPAGPINPGNDINYLMNTCNVSSTQVASATTLTNAPGGANSGVFEIFPIPNQTSLKAGQAFPAGTLYSVSPLTDNPVTAAVWTSAAPADLTTVRRVAFNRGASLAAGNTCTSNQAVVVTINLSANANLPVLAIVDSFVNNTFGVRITDQSGDTVSNSGNGRADLSPASSTLDGTNLSPPGNVDGDGVLLLTLIARLGSVFNGPNGAPQAVGPNHTNDDYTNRSVTVGIAGVAPGGNTTAAGSSLFQNTVENTGNADDVYTLTVTNFASLPAGTTLVITTPNGAVTVDDPSDSVTINVARGATANYTVQFNLPAGQTVLTGYAATIRATSGNTPAQSNDTIDRLYTGFLLLQKSVSIDNTTGVGGATDAVPGADIVYSITYENVSSGGGGAGNVQLTATNIAIREDGGAAPNNWASNTTQVTSPMPSATGGTVVDNATNLPVTAGTTFLRADIPSLAPAATGTFTFRRRIN